MQKPDTRVTDAEPDPKQQQRPDWESGQKTVPTPDFRRTFFKLWSLKVPSTNLLRQNHEKEAEVVKIEDSKISNIS
jgi:hypothetical protein